MPNLSDLLKAKEKKRRQAGERVRGINNQFPTQEPPPDLSAIGRRLSQGTGHPGINAADSPKDENYYYGQTRIPHTEPRLRPDQITDMAGQITVTPPSNPGESIESKIAALLGRERPATEGRFVNEYTQAQLNQIAQGLASTGAQNAALYRENDDSVRQLYEAALGRRADENQGVFDELSTNLRNIGGNLAQLPQGARLQSEAAFLDEAAGQNQAADLAFNSKMAALSQATASQLAQQARAGLLTDQRYTPGDPGGFSEADKFRLQQLAEEQRYNRDRTASLEDQALAAAFESDLALKETATENFEHTNPLFTEALSEITDPSLRDEFARLYDLGGGPEGALKLLAETSDPLERGPFLNEGDINPDTGQPYHPLEIMNRNLSRDLEFSREKELRAEEEAINAALIDLFRNISPSYRGVPTKRTTTNKSTRDF